METERRSTDDGERNDDAPVDALAYTATALGGPDALTVRAYVALGSNLGDRAAALRAAVAEMSRRPGIRVAGVSPIYEASAHTLPDQASQPSFLNAVAALDTSLSATDLLTALLDVERGMGRKREGGRWEARDIDLDLVLYGDRVVHEAGLTVPHPRLPDRRFVLAPLADLAANLEVPGTGNTVAQMLEACVDTGAVSRTNLRVD
jgi:2-amino-4-hydroxy-6-hydroxymethyldihydropteridine diphosphokinase